jgi:hypothetical protein
MLPARDVRHQRILVQQQHQLGTLSQLKLDRSLPRDLTSLLDEVFWKLGAKCWNRAGHGANPFAFMTGDAS